MFRLSSPVMDLYCLTGESINTPLIKSVEGLTVSEQALQMQRKRVEDAFKGERVDHIPVGADLRWWFAERYNDGTIRRDLEGCDLDKIISCSLGTTKISPPVRADPLPGVEVDVKWEGCLVQYVNGGYPGSYRTVRVSTPVGSLIAKEGYASRSFGILEHPVKTIEDLNVVRYIYEKRVQHSTSEPPVKGWCAPMTPLQILIIHLAGVESAVYLLADYPDEVEDFMLFLEEIHRPVIEYLAQQGRILFSVENFTSEVSGGYFDKYLGPQMLRRSNIAQKYGAGLGVHHDGKLHPLFGRLKEVGVKYVNGITAAYSEMEGLREAAGNEMVLSDIIPQFIFMPQYRQENFEKFVLHAAEVFKNDNKVILGIGDMLPCISDIRRFETMIDIITEYTHA